MTGDASLGITPVMKWNFERSCYRWLVTRHPAQFERLDFTAQILQSASRARKAFYECGWAEAKVLIRPSDGKFERTPFFDTIIRRGLRNSTRFDASTLTEEEIEALGMHRDETLGFKLQIRHFRSTRKERPPPPPPPPQGRVTGGTEPPKSSPGIISTTSTTFASRKGGPSSGPGSPLKEKERRGGDDNSCGAPHSSEVSVAIPRSLEAERWSEEGPPRSPRSAIGADRCWSDKDGWRHPRGGGSGTIIDGDPGGRDRWAAWVKTRHEARHEARQWDAGSESAAVAAAENTSRRGRCRPVIMAASASPWTQAPSPAPAAARNLPQWDGTPGRTWGFDRRVDPWNGSSGADVKRVLGKPERGSDETNDAELRDGRGGDSRGSGRQQSEAEIRASFRHREEVLSRRPRRILPAPGVGGGGSGSGSLTIRRSVSSEVVESRDGGLLAQGYLRLAAMSDRGENRRTAVPSGGNSASNTNTSTTAHQLPCGLPGFDKLDSGVGSKRPAEGGVGGDGRSFGLVSDSRQKYTRPSTTVFSSWEEDGPLKKRRLPGQGERSSIGNGASPQIKAQAKLERSPPLEKRLQVLAQPQDAPTTPPAIPKRDLLERELEESERQLTSARHALDAAKARYDEASRVHRAKKDQLANKSSRRAAAAEHALEESNNLHSLARSCQTVSEAKEVPVGIEMIAVSDGGKMSVGASSSRVGNEDRHEKTPTGQPQDHLAPRSDDTCRSPVSSSPTDSATDRSSTDEMRDVKLQAALLCGIGRAPVPPLGRRHSAGCSGLENDTENSPKIGSGLSAAAISPSIKHKLPSSKLTSISSNNISNTINNKSGALYNSYSKSRASERQMDGATSRRLSPPLSSSSPLPNLTLTVPDGLDTVYAGGTPGPECSKRSPPLRPPKCGDKKKDGNHPLWLTPLSLEARNGGAFRARSSPPTQRGGIGIGIVRSGVFPPPLLATHLTEGGPVSSAAHRTTTTRVALPSMAQMPPGSPGSGETDSEQSDNSTNGAGFGRGLDDSRPPPPPSSQQQRRSLESRARSGVSTRDGGPSYRHLSGIGGGSWGGYPGREGGSKHGAYVAPLAKLVAVETAGARGSGGCILEGFSSA